MPPFSCANLGFLMFRHPLPPQINLELKKPDPHKKALSVFFVWGGVHINLGGVSGGFHMNLGGGWVNGP